MKKTDLKLIAALLVFGLIVLGLGACSSKEEEKNGESQGSPVKFINPRITNMTSELQLTATTLFLKKEIVRAPFSGYIQKCYKNLGDQVKEGELLFLMQTKESYALMSGSSKSDEQGKYSIQVKAKSDGSFSQLNFHEGDFISEGEQIAVVSNPNSIAVALNVPFNNISQVKIGTVCRLILPDGKKLNGTISRAIPSVDPSSQTQTYIINCSGVTGLPENLNITALIPSQYAAGALVVPKGCVLCNETMQEFWIMKLINDSSAVKLVVKKGIENDSLIQILSPKLGVDERIVSEGGYGLTDTAKVKIER